MLDVAPKSVELSCSGPCPSQQQGSPLRKYFIPGCVERGLVLDLRVCPQAAPAAGAGKADKLKFRQPTVIDLLGDERAELDAKLDLLLGMMGRQHSAQQQ